MQETLTVTTEVGLLGVWDQHSLTFITEQNYNDYFIRDESMLELMNHGKGIFWGTGSDGYFEVTVRINEPELSTDESKNVALKTENLQLNVGSGSIFLGSPELTLVSHDKSSRTIQVKPGRYNVGIYFLYEENTNLSKYLVCLKQARDGYTFQAITEFPQLG